MTARTACGYSPGPHRSYPRYHQSRRIEDTDEGVYDVPTPISVSILERPSGLRASPFDEPTRPESIQPVHQFIKTVPFPRPARNSHYPSYLHCSLLLSVVRPSLSHRKPHQIIRITLGNPQHPHSLRPHQEALGFHHLARYSTKTQLRNSGVNLHSSHITFCPGKTYYCLLLLRFPSSHRTREEGAHVLHNTVDKSFINSLRRCVHTPLFIASLAPAVCFRVLAESSELHAIVWSDSGCR